MALNPFALWILDEWWTVLLHVIITRCYDIVKGATCACLCNFSRSFFCLYNVLCLSLLSFTLSSLFVWSNETMNIWTHLLGLIYFFYLLIYDNFSLLEDSHSDFGDNLTFTLMDSAFMVRDPFTLSLYLRVLFFLCPDLHVLFRIFSSFQLHIGIGK